MGGEKMNPGEKRVCPGCGAPLQSEDKNLPGYLPIHAWEKEEAVCLRCFRIKHYNEAVQVDLREEDFLQVLHSIGSTEALVVHLVDLIDVNGTLLSGLHRFIGQNPFLLVGNKLDLLPQRVNLDRIRRWLLMMAMEWGLKPVDVMLISALKGSYLQELLEKLEAYRKGKNVYFIGATNVGKSTFMNRLLKEYGEKGTIEITTSRFPGTTLDLIEIPVDEHSSFYDTPGVMTPHQIIRYLSPEDLKKVIPQKRINPKVYQLEPEQTLFLGGMARIDFISGTPQSFIVYISNEIPVHRTKRSHAGELQEKHRGELLSPPGKENLDRLPPWVKHSFNLKEGEKQDIAISGLGWVSFSGKKGRVDVFAPKGVSVQIRKGMI